MRIALHIDGATTDEIRNLARLLNGAGLTGQLEVGVDGPNFWNARTPKMTPDQQAWVLTIAGQP